MLRLRRLAESVYTSSLADAVTALPARLSMAATDSPRAGCLALAMLGGRLPDGSQVAPQELSYRSCTAHPCHRREHKPVDVREPPAEIAVSIMADIIRSLRGTKKGGKGAQGA